MQVQSPSVQGVAVLLVLDGTMEKTLPASRGARCRKAGSSWFRPASLLASCPALDEVEASPAKSYEPPIVSITGESGRPLSNQLVRLSTTIRPIAARVCSEAEPI